MISDIENSGDELNRIAKKIVNLFESRKPEGQRYFTSALGIDLGEDLATLKQLTNKGLNDFIQLRLADRFTLERSGAHNNVTAMIARGAGSDEFAPTPAHAREKSARFHYRFWAAFSVLPKDAVRILDDKDFTFKDVPQTDELHGALTIPNHLIVAADAEERNEKIKTNIATWLAERGLPEERFIVSHEVSKARTAVPMASTLLHAVIGTLDRRQLQSVSLPLDVVDALIRTPRN